MTRALTALFLALAAMVAVAADVAETATQIVDGTNAFRQAQGLAPLDRDAELAGAARAFAGYMAKTGKYGHTADGRRPSQRAAAEGYEYCIVGENIAYQYRSDGFASSSDLSAEFVEGWKNSPEHRANMLDSAVTQTGVGVAQGDGGRYFAVQMFGRPKSAAIRFEIENRSGKAVEYRAGEKRYSLRPRQTRIHGLCRPTQLTISRATAQEAFTAEAQDGRRYSVREDSVAVEAARAE